jgi:hypothetical protein
MVSLRKSTLVVVLALVAVLLVGGGVLAATVGRNGKAVTAVRTVTANASFLSTPSYNTWVDVPDMKLFLTVPRDQKAVLVITFSMSSSCTPIDAYVNANCSVRVILDGNAVDPGGVEWDWTLGGDAAFLSARSMQWVAGPVLPGEHQVKVQLSASAGTIFGSDRTLTVLRSKV